MENSIWILLIVAGLIAGIGLGFFMDTPEEVIQPVCPEAPACEVCVTETCPLELTDLALGIAAYRDEVLQDAIDEFLDELDDEDDLRCGFSRYDVDELTISKMYWYAITYDDEDYTIDFKAKVKFDEDDERSCRETYEVSVFYEEDEKPLVTYEKIH